MLTGGETEGNTGEGEMSRNRNIRRFFLGLGMAIAFIAMPQPQDETYLTLEGGFGMKIVVSFGWYAAAFLAPRLIPKYGKKVRLQFANKKKKQRINQTIKNQHLNKRTIK